MHPDSSRKRKSSSIQTNDEENEENGTVAQSVGLLVLIPILVLLITAIIIWRPLFLACYQKLWDLMFEIILCCPFIGMCMTRVSRTDEHFSVKAFVKGIWLAFVWISWLVFLCWPIIWAVKFDKYWPIILYIAPLIFYAPRNPNQISSSAKESKTSTNIQFIRQNNSCRKTVSSKSSSKGGEDIIISEKNSGTTSANMSKVVDSIPNTSSMKRKLFSLRKVLELLFWYAPQEFSAQICIRVFGVRIHEPFASIVDTRLAIGSAPLTTKDMFLLQANFHVSALLVVEPSETSPCFPLSDADFEDFDIARIRIRETDSLHIDDLTLAVRFIRHRLDTEPQRRVFVSCPDGIRFAPAFILAFLISSQQCELDHAAAALDRRLPRNNSASASLLYHPSLRHFADRLNSERLLETSVAVKSAGDDGWDLIDKSDLC